MIGEEEEEYVGNQGIPPNYLPSQQQSEAGIRFQLDPEEIINHITNILLGRYKRFNPESGEHEWCEDDNCKRFINEEGVRAVESELRGRLNQIFILSDLDHDQIAYMSIGCFDALRKSIRINYKRWEISGTTSASRIVRFVGDSVYATLSKAYLHGYQNFMKTNYRIQEVQQLSQTVGDGNQAKGSIFNPANWGKK
jgi:hypothetical protein|tara:strand:- start:6195 stop:6782 length:588 start_codon:yes stop_codon:yes gene_type:complete